MTASLRSALLCLALVGGACERSSAPPTHAASKAAPVQTSVPPAPPSASASEQRTSKPTPPPPAAAEAPPRVRVEQVTLGDTHACVRAQGGTVWCWGDPQGGVASNVPQLVAGIDQVTQISAGYAETYALRADGSIWVWGGRNGPRPVRVANRSASALAMGDPASCVIGVDQQLSCTGLNDRGRLGVGSPTGKGHAPRAVAKPQKVPGLPKVAQAVLGDVSGCALSVDHALYCWGLGFRCSGPTLQKPSDAALVALTGAKDHYCVLDANSKVRCLAPVSRGTQAMEQDTCEDYEELDRSGLWSVVGAGSAAAATAPPLCERCAGCFAGTSGAECWNDDRDAPFGNSAMTGLVHIQSAHRFVELAISANVACAVTDDARVACWGKNRFEQLGDGSSREESRLTPLEPRFPN